MDKDLASRVPELVEKLIKHHLPSSKSERYQSYFLRLLSSRLTPSVSQSEGAIQDLISKRLKLSDSSRFQALCVKLSKNKAVTKKWAILYLLNKIQDTPSITIPSTPLEVFAPKRQELDTNKPPQPFISAKREPSLSPLDADILKDVLFAFQGIEGKYISFSMWEDSFTIQPGIGISEPVRRMVYELAEMGWLYKKVTSFISDNIEQLSLTGQSLCYSFQAELTEYYRLIALLEQQLSAQKNLNLRKLYLWCEEPLERMRWLAVLADAVEGLKGGSLVSAVYSYTRIGNSSVKALLTSILDEVSQSLMQMIQAWMLQGELNDPYQEFFVSANQAIPEERLWHEKYKLNTMMVPAFFDEHLANTILITGKSINFLRKCCNEEEWAAEAPLELPKIHDLSELKRWVDSAAEVTHDQVMKVLFHKYRFKEHCNSIKKYLLLAQGDFHHYLMELLVKPLNERAKKIYKHNIVSMLESAIRASNARFDDHEFLNRVDVKLLEPSDMDVGWDVFTLDYIVRSPLSTIFTEESMLMYMRLFKFLWLIKRVNFYINSYQDTKTLLTLETMPDVKPHLHKAQLVRYEISHFVNNMTSYLMFEVVEGSWEEFKKSMNKAKGLDELIKMHSVYVDTLVRKAFLSPDMEKLHKQLLRLVELASRFSSDHETLINSASDEFNRRKMLQSQRELLRDDEMPDISRISQESIFDISEIAEQFPEGVQKFRSELVDTDKTHLKFLSFRLDFNEFYSRSAFKKDVNTGLRDFDDDFSAKW